MLPTGRVEHAEGEGAGRTAREVLRSAVVRVERARTRGGKPGSDSVSAWNALVEGRWSLVDRFDHDGKRYILARRNEPGAHDLRALSARECAVAQLAAVGKANKLIAYELGLSESTVATHLASAIRKLGVRTRVELIELVARLVAMSRG